MSRLNQLRSLRPAIFEIAAKHGMRRVRIFGSVARGEEMPSSDVDVLVDTEPGVSLFDLAGFELDLEDLLHCKVDVVTEDGLSPYLEDHILQEAIPL